MKQVTIYTDGCSLGNPGPGGWCAIAIYKGVEKIFSGNEELTTNNKMELKAVIEALKALKEPCEVKIVTDSTYVANGINNWLQNWVKKDFNGVKNDELWREYLELSKIHKIKATWIKSHAGEPYNERCDKIAKSEAAKHKNK